MNKVMAIAMIVVGVLLVVFGIVSLSKDNKQDKPEPQVIVVQTPAPATPALAENVTATGTAGAQQSVEDDAKTKGNNFEAYVVDVFKHGNKFRILEWHQGATSPNGHYAEDELNPDLKIALPREGGSDIDFWVECKYRSWIGDEGFSLPAYQMERYRKHQHDTRRKVLIAIGAGGDSDAPKSLFIIPVDSLTADVPVSYNDLKPFKVVNPSENIQTYIENYFYTKVFTSSRKR